MRGYRLLIYQQLDDRSGMRTTTKRDFMIPPSLSAHKQDRDGGDMTYKSPGFIGKSRNKIWKKREIHSKSLGKVCPDTLYIKGG